MKKISELIKAFYCDAQGGFVVCKAPYQCHQMCAKYKAKRVSGIEERPVLIKTGYIEGMHLVQITE